MRKSILYPLIVLIVAGFVAPLLHGADQANEPTTFKMTVHAQATTRPALAIRLLPSLTDQTPGDAAPVYLLAATLWTRDSNTADKEIAGDMPQRFGLSGKDDWTMSDVLMEAPLAKLKSPELAKYLADHQSVLELLDIASQRGDCHWDLPFREQGFRTLLPHLQALRGAARAICVKARSQLADGDIKGAMRTIQINFAMARALNQQAVLIQSLVGASITTMSLKVVREASELPGAPNFYWTLADLPRPMFDLHVPMEWERSALYFTLPQLRKVKEGTFTEADWRSLMEAMQMMMQSEGRPPNGDLMEQLAMAAKTAFIFPQARRYLIRQGMTEEQVDALPKPAVLGRYIVESFSEVYDDITKWTTLPYWQAREGLEKSERELKESIPKSNPLLLVVPAVNRAFFSLRRLDRDIAAVEAAEALRDYAARHDGALPKSLEDITETPVPVDPIWGKPFHYKVEGQTAILESAAPDPSRKSDGLVVTVMVVR